MAELLNNQFASVFQSEKGLILPAFQYNAAIDSELGSVKIFEADVAERLSKLDSHKSMGVDGIHPHVLRACSEEFARPLTYIFVTSLRDSTLPKIWLKANVTPIFKKGSRIEPSNYRPISLTSVVCKVMESIVRDAIMHHLKINNLISVQQHGFVPSRACNTNLIETVDLVTSSMWEKKPVDIVFFDFSKAFDKVPHRRLILKLRGLGIGGSLINWLEAFLSNREQRVVLGQQASEWVTVNSGVPQGSVLGPTLFVTFINDLPSQLSNTCKLYADDLKIIAKIESVADISTLQADLNAVTEWCNTWLMEPNVDKCKVMNIGGNSEVGRSRTYSLLRNDGTTVELKQTTEERDLGIILTPDFKFSAQAAHAASKANAMTSTLKHTFISRDVETWASLYRTYIRPHLEFAISAWNPSLRRDITLLEKAQRRVTRLPNPLRGIGYEARLERMHLTTLETRRLRGDLIQMFKATRGADIIHWHNKPVWSEPRESRRSQLRREIVLSCHQRRNFFINRIANEWNALPDVIVESESGDSFKKKLDEYLLRRPL